MIRKMIPILTILTLFHININAMSKLYIGEESGELFAGMEVGYTIQTVDILFDVNSKGLLRATGLTFAPTLIEYTFGIESNGIEFKHTCWHSVDSIRAYGDGYDSENSLSYKIKWYTNPITKADLEANN